MPNPDKLKQTTGRCRGDNSYANVTSYKNIIRHFTQDRVSRFMIYLRIRTTNDRCSLHR